MKNSHIIIGTVLLVCGTCSSAQSQLEGDQRLACEAILCLAAAGVRPAQCAPSIQRYFSISFRKFSDTLRGRLNFLNLCPIVSSDMAALKNALVNGSGRCDAASLNQQSFVGVDAEGNGGYVSNTMPAHCAELYANAYAQANLRPRYVGAPESGGHWVEAKDWSAAQAAGAGVANVGQ